MSQQLHTNLLQPNVTKCLKIIQKVIMELYDFGIFHQLLLNQN